MRAANTCCWLNIWRIDDNLLNSIAMRHDHRHHHRHVHHHIRKVFGSILSATDPVAVVALLKTAGEQQESTLIQ